MSGQEQPTFFDLKGEIGPWVVGNIISSCLYGMLALQLVVYYVRSPFDHYLLKLAVSCGFFLATMSWAADIWMLWRIIFEGRTNDWALIMSPNEAMIPLAVAPFAALLSQSYFAMRTWKLSGKNIPLAALFATVMAASLAAGLGRIVISAQRPFLVYGAPDLVNFPDEPDLREHYWLSMHFLESFLLISGVTDVVITTALAFCLTRSEHWTRGFNERTDVLVKRVLRLSIMTGAVSSTSAFIDGFLIIGTVSSPRNFNAHLAMCLIQPHIYALVLVGSLNMRRVINADHASTRPRSRSWSYFTVGRTASGVGTSSAGDGTNSASTPVARSFHYSREWDKKKDPFGSPPASPRTPGSATPFIPTYRLDKLGSTSQDAAYPALPTPPPPFGPASPSALWSPPPPMTPPASASASGSPRSPRVPAPPRSPVGVAR